MKTQPAIKVYFLVLPDSLILDWAGPAEALRIANQSLRSHGAAQAFELHFVGPETECASSVGACISRIEPLPTLRAQEASPHWVVVVGQPGEGIKVTSQAMQKALTWLRSLTLRSGDTELLCVCAGAVVAAHAGLLRGRKVTTHHQHLDELAQIEPACEVVRNRVFVVDSPVSSSAGVTTGLDLCLHKISEVCGPALAAQVAQTMVVALRRGPQDPELSPFLSYRHHMHPVLHRVQDAVSMEPQLNWTVQSMAEVAHTSPRHLARVFSEHAQVPPLQYLRRIRLASAQVALQSGLNVTKAAEIAGFSSDAQLRRSWRELGMPGSPSNAKQPPI